MNKMEETNNKFIFLNDETIVFGDGSMYTRSRDDGWVFDRMVNIHRLIFVYSASGYIDENNELQVDK